MAYWRRKKALKLSWKTGKIVPFLFCCQKSKNNEGKIKTIQYLFIIHENFLLHLTYTELKVVEKLLSFLVSWTENFLGVFINKKWKNFTKELRWKVNYKRLTTVSFFGEILVASLCMFCRHLWKMWEQETTQKNFFILKAIKNLLSCSTRREKW